MTRRLMLQLPTLIVAGLLVLGFDRPAQATLQVTINGVIQPLADPTNTSVAINFDSSPFAVAGVALGTNFLGVAPPGGAGMDLATFSATSSAPATLQIIVSQNGLTFPIGLGAISQTLTGQFATGAGTVALTTFGDQNNTLYSVTPTSNPPTTVGTPTIGLGGTSSVNFTSVNPYSLTQVLTINFTEAGTVTAGLSSDATSQFVAVPEPGSIIAALTALPLLGGFYLRRRWIRNSA